MQSSRRVAGRRPDDAPSLTSAQGRTFLSAASASRIVPGREGRDPSDSRPDPGRWPVRIVRSRSRAAIRRRRGRAAHGSGDVVRVGQGAPLRPPRPCAATLARAWAEGVAGPARGSAASGASSVRRKEKSDFVGFGLASSLARAWAAGRRRAAPGRRALAHVGAGPHVGDVVADASRFVPGRDGRDLYDSRPDPGRWSVRIVRSRTRAAIRRRRARAARGLRRRRRKRTPPRGALPSRFSRRSACRRSRRAPRAYRRLAFARRSKRRRPPVRRPRAAARG